LRLKRQRFLCSFSLEILSSVGVLGALNFCQRLSFTICMNEFETFSILVENRSLNSQSLWHETIEPSPLYRLILTSDWPDDKWYLRKPLEGEPLPQARAVTEALQAAAWSQPRRLRRKNVKKHFCRGLFRFPLQP